MKLEKIKYKFFDKTIRNIYILLPKKIDGKLNTLYMFDGEATIIGSEFSKASWEVEKAIKKAKVKNLAVVAIDNAGKDRMSEYLPFDYTHHGKEIIAKGPELADFLKNDLIPFLENKYPLSAKKEDRYLAGSSMGGIITAAYSSKLKDTFTKFGVFSLASWIFSDNLFYDYLDENEISSDSIYYIYVGDKEGYSESGDFETKKVTNSYLSEYKRFIKYLVDNEVKEIKADIGKDCTHSEKSWAKYLYKFIEMF